MSTTYTIPNTAAHWLATGERGVSSETIWAHLSGLPVVQRKNTPSDPADLRRCRLLLEAVPEFAARLNEMRYVSVRWATIIEHWDTLCKTFDEECPNWRNGDWLAPKTFKLMQQILG